jgi:hypothetical protein
MSDLSVSSVQQINDIVAYDETNLSAAETMAERELFPLLDAIIDAMWKASAEAEFWQHVMAQGIDAELYRDLMVQVFHYTRFNSINQGMTVLGVSPAERPLLRFIYRHADGELGHEQLVVHDLRAAGLIGPEVQPETLPRLPATWPASLGRGERWPAWATPTGPSPCTTTSRRFWAPPGRRWG